VAGDSRLVDNQADHRYELWVGDDRVGTIDYGTLPEAIVLIHTEVDPAFEGKATAADWFAMPSPTSAPAACRSYRNAASCAPTCGRIPMKPTSSDNTHALQ
jgi:hypothetical protein